MSLDALTSTRSEESSSLQSSSKRKRSYAWLLPVGLVLGFLIILALLFGKRLLPAVTVKTAPVVTLRAGEELSSELTSAPQNTSSRPNATMLFQASGWVEPDPYTVYVPTLVNGVVDQVLVLEGQSVKKGQLVATLIDDDAKLNLQSASQKYVAFEKKILAHCTEYGIIDAEVIAAKGKIKAIQAALNEARDNSERLANLKKGAVSEQKVVMAKLATQRQIAKLAEANAELPRLDAERVQLKSQKESMDARLLELETERDRAQLAFDRTQIRSTMDGVVLRLHAAPGKKRMLDMDDPKSAVIVELYDPNQLQARIDVPLNEAAALSSGQSVELVSDLLPNRVFTGKVTRVSGQADLQRNTLQAKVSITDPDPRLRPDMLLRAKFYALQDGKGDSGKSVATSSARLALYVPEIALFNESSVWVVSSDHTAEKRALTLGKHTRENHRLVLSGLRSGESVILPPHNKLKPGTRVEVTP